MGVYTIKAMDIVDEYIKLDADFSKIREACQNSDMQFLDYRECYIEASDHGGMEFPDLFYQDGIYIMSDKIVRKIKAVIEDYVFLKPVKIVCDILGKKESYWIVVPPRIDCLDLENSEVDYDWDFNLGIIPVLPCTKAVVDEQLLGRFQMFKISGIDDNNIYFTDGIKEKIVSSDPEGIKIIKC